MPKGVYKRTKSAWNKINLQVEDIEKIRNEYANLKSSKSVAYLFGCSSSFIVKTLKKNNIETNKRGEYLKGKSPWNKGNVFSNNKKKKIINDRIEKVRNKYGTTYCSCGCGKEIKIKEYHFYEGPPKFISGHNPLIFTPEIRRKQRESTIKYIENHCNGISPRVGKYEKDILDYLQNECFYYPILRQYKVAGYFLDGYCSALNLAIEVDEKKHRKSLERDSRREKEIKDEINCNFLRIQV